MKIHIEIVGYILVCLAAAHAIFPKYFKWKHVLSEIPQVSREIMYVHTFFIALTVLLMGSLCISSSDYLLNTELGRNLSIGFAVFWTIRLFVQFFGYSPSLWKGKRFETMIHIVFSILWLDLACLFWAAAIV